MHHVIQVSFEGEKVKAIYNPHPGDEGTKPVSPGDTVTWYITPANRELQVLFRQAGPLGKLEPCNPLGPFNSVSISTGLIVGTIRLDDQVKDKRFLYDLFEKGEALKWYNGINNAYGGIDIPMTPMMAD